MEPALHGSVSGSPIRKPARKWIVTTVRDAEANTVHSINQVTLSINTLACPVLRYGLSLVIAWLGVMKFTGYEAKVIEPLVAHSPLLSWTYRVWTVRQLSIGLGVVELAIALLIALRPRSPRACAVGSVFAILMFLVTLSFLVSTPGWEPSLGGFPALSESVGQFLIKDVVLLGAAIYSLGEALASIDAPPGS